MPALSRACAAGVEEALVQLRRQRFSAVLTDLKLPAGSGLDVLKAALDDDPAVPVIIMTAYASTESAIQALKYGAFDYLQKPFRVDELIATLRRGIEFRKFQAERAAQRLHA